MSIETFDQIQATTVFALLACIGSFLTWITMILLEIFETDRNWWAIFYSVMGALLSAWFAVGFFMILLGIEVESESYFRPMLVVLVSLYTGGGVMIYRSRTRDSIIIKQQHIIEDLRKQRNTVDSVIEKSNVME